MQKRTPFSPPPIPTFTPPLSAPERMNCPLGDQSTQATAAPCPLSVISLSSRAPIPLVRRDSEKNRELDEWRILGEGVC